MNEPSEIPDVYFAGIGPCRGNLAIVDRCGLKNRSEPNARTAELQLYSDSIDATEVFQRHGFEFRFHFVFVVVIIVGFALGIIVLK